MITTLLALLIGSNIGGPVGALLSYASFNKEVHEGVVFKTSDGALSVCYRKQTPRHLVAIIVVRKMFYLLNRMQKPVTQNVTNSGVSMGN